MCPGPVAVHWRGGICHGVAAAYAVTGTTASHRAQAPSVLSSGSWADRDRRGGAQALSNLELAHLERGGDAESAAPAERQTPCSMSPSPTEH